MWNNLIIGNLYQLSIFFKEYEIVKEIEPEEAEEIPVAEVEEALPVEGIQSTYLEAAGHLSFSAVQFSSCSVILHTCASVL